MSIRCSTLACFLIASVAASSPSLSQTSPPQNSDFYKHLDALGNVLDTVRKEYVEELDDRKLIEGAIIGILNSLDPGSSYISTKNFHDMLVQTRGEFGGLGVEVTMVNGVVKIVSPIDDSPASEAGLLAGDLITHLDGEPVIGLTLMQAVEKMRGPVNTPMVLTVVRASKDAAFDVKILRQVIRVNPVKHRAENGVGYIRITRFNEITTEKLHRALKLLSDNGSSKIHSYIIDLRNNPGGLLNQAISVSDTFLERGAIVVTRGRDPNTTQRYNASAGDMAARKPIVVLINGGTASAAEIVAGALQDHQRAKIVGTRSFGRGTVTTIIPIGAYGALRLTTARNYTPSGRSIQAKGIEPDIIVEQELPSSLSPEQGQKENSIPIDRSEDKQLQYAIALLTQGVPHQSSGKSAQPEGSEIDLQMELAFWESVKDSKDATLIKLYLKKFPNGAFSGLAKALVIKYGENQ